MRVGLAAALVAVLVVMVARSCRPRPLRARHTPTLRRAAVVPAEEWARLLDTMAADIRGGSSTRVAFQRAVDRVRPNGEVVRPGTSLERVVGRAPRDRDEALAALVIDVAADLGGAAAAAVQSGATLLRERAAAAAEAHAHSAQARLSVKVLTIVPLVFAGWSMVASSSFRAAVLTAPGAISAAAGAGCNVAGWCWMRRIIRRAAS